MAQNGTRVADLPDVDQITPESYLIIEKPGYGQGTFKGTVAQLTDGISIDVTEIKEHVAQLDQEVSYVNSQLTNINSRLRNVESEIGQITAVLMWEGTRVQWNSLSPSERSNYKIVCITDE